METITATRIEYFIQTVFNHVYEGIKDILNAHIVTQQDFPKTIGKKILLI